MAESVHEPVLLKEVITYLEPRSGEFMVDGTMDGGGHAAAILKAIGQEGKFLGLDWDEPMVKKAEGKFQEFPGAKFLHGNYADLPDILQENGLGQADGLLLDLGFSSEQIESSGRGFSFMKDEPLLMTYDDKKPSAREILRTVDERVLGNIIFEFGEEKFSRQIAKAIKTIGRKKPIQTSKELVEVIQGAVPGNYEHGRINPATRTFQALRIYVNDELGNLKKVLVNIPKILRTGGRVVIITFHSLEDRIVKQQFKHLERDNLLRILTKKPLFTTREEIIANPRSRSAKLRAGKLI